MSTEGALNTRTIVRFWLPLAATWLMMSAEGPYLAAVIARLPDATYNLGAYGAAFAIAWLAESPIMMLLTAANALIHGRQSFIATRQFAYRLNALVTSVMLIVVAPPVFNAIAYSVMGLPAEVAARLHLAIAILIPWPAAIGYRRFYQGVLVRHGQTRRVAYGTVIRIVVMSAVAAIVATTTSAHGSTVAAFALSSGVIAEACVSRWMARHAVAAMLDGTFGKDDEPLTQSAIIKFYTPLALTSMIAMVTAPILTFFMGRGRMPIESLAVLPVVNNLVFMFRSGGVAFQDVSVALSGRHHEHQHEVGRAAFLLASVTTALLVLLLFTPLAGIWLQDVAGLPPDLYDYAITTARIIVVLPAIEYFLSFQRSQFIINRQTTVITMSMAIEVTLIGAMLVLCIAQLGMVGAIAASCSIVTGRVASSTYLYVSSRAAATSRRSRPGGRPDERFVLPTPPEPES
ncbi:MAG TPA: hypothetical protein VJR92_02145 [Gemmatimonadaceae bacterium]|nr:hypothetical protein [Gemmatimonadaceae bacterium]